ncbi:MAG TPA: PEP-CTERM sorting domain-containing protein [Candidatus Brocadiia bacterium]|nr:PEP-CTERM sorting domain-containing protein [Candidatus Brocadiia bacterium]
MNRNLKRFSPRCGQRKRWALVSLALLSLCLPALGETISPTVAVDATGDTATSSTMVSTASTSLTLGSAGAVLVMSSFSAMTTNATAQTGSWELRVDGGSASQTINRYLSGTNDRGVITAVNIFTGVSSGTSHSFDLYHATSGTALQTYGTTLVAIPLVTDSGSALPYGMGTLGSGGESIASTSLTPLATSGSWATVTLATAGDIFVAASLNSRSDTGGGNSSRTGQWQLGIYSSDGSTRLGTLGSTVSRFLSGTADTGAVTLYGLANDYAAGTYVIKLEAATDSGSKPIITENLTLAAVGLSLANGQYFDAFQATTASVATSSTSFTDALSGSITLPETGQIVLASSFSTSSSAAATGSFRLDDSPNYTGQEVNRYLSGVNDTGSGGVVGLTSSLAAATYTPSLQYQTTSGTLTASGVTLIGFSTSSTPEPATLALFALVAVPAALALRRRAARTQGPGEA